MHERRYAGGIERLRSPERVRLLEVERVIDLALSGAEIRTVLDVGTGSGIFAEAFARRGLSVTGIDPQPGMLEAAREYVPAGVFQSGTVEQIPFPDRSFDLVFLGHVLHESDDLERALGETVRCARARVAILEWPYLEETAGPPIAHRLRPEEILETARKIGCRTPEVRRLDHMVLILLPGSGA
ncbi:MAG TPA: class I SAM-dependent methyltransferase [Bacteroidota bacterium]|nr:class I SAM-dependent methyltransferase [Bacteroidota bacterium]